MSEGFDVLVIGGGPAGVAACEDIIDGREFTTIQDRSDATFAVGYQLDGVLNAGLGADR